MALKQKETPDKGTPGYRSKSGDRRSRFPEEEKIRILKTLQLNGFNYMLTSRQTGVSTNSLKEWRKKYPEAFNNHYTNRSLATIESIAVSESKKIIEHAGKLLKLSLEQAERILEYETDLSKVSSFIRSITPIAKTMSEVDKENGFRKVSSLTQTLEKLAQLNGKDIEDVTPIEDNSTAES